MMPFVSINGILVNYPYEPYKCQSDYMKNVIDALEKGQNAVLESPTGTGKTLCLLCSCLSWLSEQRSKLHRQNWEQLNEEIESKNGMRLDNNHSFDETIKPSIKYSLPKIIYTSRTHSQLTQVIREFKKTVYANQFRMSILGSREQMCIHVDVIKEPNCSNKIKICRNKIQNRTCHFYNQVEKKMSLFTNMVCDIEDLVLNGRKNACCPYYVAKAMSKDSDIIFMPYNYLIDYKIRKLHAVDLNNSIVIFDEAHNLEQMCEESASFSLSSYEIACLMSDIDATIKNIEGLDHLASTLADSSEESNVSGMKLTLEEAINLKEYALRIEKLIDEHVLNNPQTLDGSYILSLFIQTITTFSNTKSLIDTVQRCIDFTTEFSSSEGRITSITRGLGLNKLFDILHIVDFASASSNAPACLKKKFDDNYKVYLCMDKEQRTFQSKLNQRILNCWCFSSAYTIKELMQQGIRNLILTSGTLSPIKVFASNFGIKFDIILENPHVIDAEKQVWIGIIKRGPDNSAFSSKFTHRTNEDYLKSLGNAVVNFAQIIPKGILLFFPSYSVMDLCLENWGSLNIKKKKVPTATLR